MKIGVLALQGDFAEHLTALRKLKVEAREVRMPEDLKGLDGLIIPGGESTTMSLLLDRFDLREPLKKFKGPVWGTCAGAILIGKGRDPKVKNLELINIEVERNAYGRQVDSFEAGFEVKGAGEIRGVFIRAPKITKAGGGVSVLGEFEGMPVFVRQGRYLAGTFHPELTENLGLHRYFLSLVGEEKEKRA